MLEIYLFTLIRSQLSSQLKYFRRGWDRKEGRGHKNFEKGAKQGQGVGALVGWNPLTNYVWQTSKCAPPFLLWGGEGGMGGLSIQPNFQKQRAWQDLNF